MADPVVLVLPATPESAALARAFIREHATLDSMRHSEADLLVTELIANVVQHAPEAGDITVSLSKEGEIGLVVSVSHAHAEPLAPTSSGVGFMLLERLSRSWGHHHEDGILTVWFALRTPGTTAIPADLSDEELFARMSQDAAAYSDELVRRHGDLASGIARRYRGKGIDEDDLIQVAHMALLKAIQRYDPSLGTIRPYAAATISGELKKLLRDRGWSVRVPRSLQERSLEVARATEHLAQILERPPDPSELASYLDLSEKDVIEALDARQAYNSTSMDQPVETSGLTLLERLEDEDPELLLADDRVVVEEAIKRLPEREQRILHLRFNEDLTQSEIAELLGISQMHVSRLLSRAFETLKKSIGNR